MRTFVSASAIVSFIGIGIVIAACGGASTPPAGTAPSATTYCGQPGQAPCGPTAPLGYGQPPYGAQPQPGYPTTAPQPQPTYAPTMTAPQPMPTTAPAPAGMSTTGTLPCTDDVACGFAHCNKTVGKCATPCQSTAQDCLPGNSCYVTPLGNICGPATGLGTVLP